MRNIKISEQIYPETNKRLFIINAPTSFKILFKMIRVFLDKNTIERIRIHSGNGLQDLLQFIDADNLPKCIGGYSELSLD